MPPASTARPARIATLSLALLGATSVALAAGDAPGSGPAPVEVAKVELGRRLFFDPAASRFGVHACADCHLPDHGWSDPERKSMDDFGPTARHSQTLIDVDPVQRTHWDGEFRTVGALVLARVTLGGAGGPARSYGCCPGEGGRSVANDAPSRLLDGGRYSEAFGAVGISFETISGAIAAFCHSIRSGASAYDRFADGERDALSPAAQRGLELFRGPAKCATCHSMEGRHPSFTDHRFHDTGVAWASSRTREQDDGAWVVTRRGGDLRAFKTPTLRDVARRAPYFHDGGAATLEAAVRHYLPGVDRDPFLDGKMPRLVASKAQVADLVAFLESLTSETRPGRALAAWSRRSAASRLRFVDALDRPLVRRPVTLAPAGDVGPGAGVPRPIDLVTDEDGWISYAPPRATHVRVLVEDGVPVEGGVLVPDTCRSATLRIPVRGRARLAVLFEPGVEAPDSLVAEQVPLAEGTGERLLTTVLRRTLGIVSGNREGAVYEAAYRTDALAEVLVAVPTRLGPRRVIATLASGEAVTLDLRRLR